MKIPSRRIPPVALEAVVDAWVVSREMASPKRVSPWRLLLVMARHVDCAGRCGRSHFDLACEIGESPEFVERHQRRWELARVLVLQTARSIKRPAIYTFDLPALRDYASRSALSSDPEVSA
jgi:hypothetical protein